MVEWFDRQGRPIDLSQAEELLGDYDYKRVAEDIFVFEGEPVRISTVWLGLNHNWMHPQIPLIFETMIFGGTLNLAQWRYGTETQALAGHADAVALVQVRHGQPQTD